MTDSRHDHQQGYTRRPVASVQARGVEPRPAAQPIEQPVAQAIPDTRLTSLAVWLHERGSHITRLPIFSKRILVLHFLRRRLPRKLTTLFKSENRWQLTYFSILVLALTAIPTGLVIVQHHNAQRYVLSNATKQLVAPTMAALDGQLKYDAKQKTYSYNPSAVQGLAALSGKGDTGSRIGGSKYYGAALARDSKQGITYTDATTKLSFSLVPQFGGLSGKHEAGYVVYPFSHGQQLYTVKENGVAEDTVITKPTNQLTLSYQLKLPSELEARQEPDGSIGIYSADPALFGNISYGGSSDQQAVQKARQNGKKTNLVFMLPAPVIRESGTPKGTGTASFTLKGNVLAVVATGLQHLSYPISLDPSVVVQSANSFTSGNNEDNNATIATSSVGRGALSGGTLSGGWTTINTATSGSTMGYNGNGTGGGGARMNGTVAYNGFLYSFGGNYNNNSNSLNSVSYAQINSNGSIGSWTVSSNTFAGGTALSNFGSTVYNGYIYVIGGQQQGGAGVATIQYALICTGKNTGIAGCSNTQGDVGTWTTSVNSTNFGTVDSVPLRAGFALVAYNGFMYAIGGINRSGNTFVGDTIYAPILANGDLGNWTATASLPSSIKGSTVAAAYNGRIYVGVTCNAGNNLLGPGGCAATSSLIIGTIASDGSISWTTTGTPTYSVFGSFNGSPEMIAANGYLYVMNGNQGSSMTSATYYTPIYANGSVGAVQTTTTTGTTATETQAAYYNGYIYIVGGYVGSTTYYAGTQYAKIDTVGNTGQYVTASHSLPAASANAGSLAYGGYLYQIGGSQGSSSAVTTVYYTSLSANGDVGTWSTTSALSSAVYGMGVAAYNGYVYVVDGNTSTTYATAPTNLVQYAQINSNGTLGSWANAGNTTLASTFYSTAAAYNGYLYRIGGYASGTVNSVEYAPINTNGTIGTWHYTHSGTDDGTSFVSGFTTARWMHASVVNGGYVYILGGRDTAGTVYSDVQYALLCTATNSGQGGCSGTAGTVGTWNATTSFNTGRANLTAAVSNGYLYIAGGCSVYANNIFWSCSTRQNDTQYAKLTTTGAIASNSGCGSAWCSTSSFTTARELQTGTIYNGYLYIFGGCSTPGTGDCTDGSNLDSDVQYAALNNGGGGADGTWTAGGSISSGRFGPGSIAVNGFLYIMGGCTTYTILGCAGITSATTEAPINSDGSLGTWTTGTALPESLWGFSTVTTGGYVYLIGGCNASSCGYITTVRSALLCTGANSGVAGCGATAGTFGTWNNSLPALGTARFGPASVVSNGYLYVSGGSNNVGTSAFNDVQSAQILSNGGLGSWSSVGSGSSFTTARFGASLVTYGNYLYLLGGSNGAASVWYSDVQMAQVQANGQLGTWQPTTSLPAATSGAVAGAANGYIYVYSTRTASATWSNQLMYAPILSNGTLGNWTITPGYAAVSSLTGGGGAIYNGNIYIAAGMDTSFNMPARSGYAPLQVQSRVAHYSYLLDLKSTSNGTVGGDPQITRFGLGFTPTSASSVVSACWQGATTAAPSSNNVFGSSSCTSNIASKTPVSWPSYGRYAFVYITLDDSLSATFSDSSQTSLTEIDTYFHASPVRRLRLGQTFTDNGVRSGTQNQLDTN